jgi:hypothetical protein
MNLKNRQQLLGILAIGALAVLAADRLVLTPLTTSWKARSERLVELKTSVQRGTTLLEREEALRDRWEEMSTNALSGAMSEAESLVLKAFDRWSRESGVSVSAVRPQWREWEDYLTLECRTDASGSLSTLTRFLYLLERDPMALKVDSLEITARDSTGQQLTLALQINGLLLKPKSS